MTVSTAVSAEVVSTPIQEKPWGNEVLFADGEHGYVGKLLTVLAGQSLSMQYHHRKDETLRLLSGEAVLEHGSSADDLTIRVLHSGETFHVPPLCVHRITAVTDAVFVEVSTCQPGWRDDVVRLSDRYGRTGTSAP
jgi:mannose-6-phosphate isomerase